MQNSDGVREDSEWGKQNERGSRTGDGEGTEKEGPLKAKKEPPAGMNPHHARQEQLLYFLIC